MSWQSALEQVLGVTHEALEQEETRWAVIGSVASALQGCRISPGDIDFLAIKPEGVQRFAQLMARYTPPGCAYRPGHEKWQSSGKEPVSIGPDPNGFIWHFGRWYVEGVRIEIAHIAGPETDPASRAKDGIWEAGPDIWDHIRMVTFQEYTVPVVPLEIQLETSLSRGMNDRADEIIAVLREKGFAGALIQKSLRGEHLKRIAGLLQGE